MPPCARTETSWVLFGRCNTPTCSLSSSSSFAFLRLGVYVPSCWMLPPPALPLSKMHKSVVHPCSPPLPPTPQSVMRLLSAKSNCCSVCVHLAFSKWQWISRPQFRGDRCVNVRGKSVGEAYCLFVYSIIYSALSSH